MPNTVIVIDSQKDWECHLNPEQVITFEQFLAHQYPVNLAAKSGKKSPLRVINLCKSHAYLSLGYYCSLIAEARGHNVIPSISTLNDLSQQELTHLTLSFMPKLLSKAASNWQVPGVMPLMPIRVVSYFGKTAQPEYEELARKVFEHFPYPILRITLNFNGGWQVQAIDAASPDSLNEREAKEFAGALDNFSGKIWRKKRASKNYRFDLAILVDPQEKLPPSDNSALKKFIAAGKSLGIDCELITQQDYQRLPEFDGLFIRTTTSIDNFSYRFAKKAELEGLVVIDDPTSILHCTNKVYLADLFAVNKVNTPKTFILSIAEQDQIDSKVAALGYPLVLKIPDGAFSVGVEKVKNKAELDNALQRLFQRSSLLLAQEYLYTEFDWRIGILNHKPIYACKYFMVRNHWQIYHHGNSRVASGNFTTLPTFEVPKVVIEAAIKSTKLIGDGFYGVDIKEINNQGYVIEINDNPSIDSGVEDRYSGDELYRIIMHEFLRKMESRRNTVN